MQVLSFEKPKKAKVKPIPETAIVSACIKYLWYLGCFIWRNNTGNWTSEYKGRKQHIRYGLPGSADIIGMTPKGRFIACECKSGKNKQTDLQISFQQKVEEKGGIYILAYGLDDIEKRKGEIV